MTFLVLPAPFVVSFEALANTNPKYAPIQSLQGPAEAGFWPLGTESKVLKTLLQRSNERLFLIKKSGVSPSTTPVALD